MFFKKSNLFFEPKRPFSLCFIKRRIYVVAVEVPRWKKVTIPFQARIRSFNRSRQMGCWAVRTVTKDRAGSSGPSVDPFFHGVAGILSKVCGVTTVPNCVLWLLPVRLTAVFFHSSIVNVFFYFTCVLYLHRGQIKTDRISCLKLAGNNFFL